MDKILLPPERVDDLLGELCVKLGYCLNPSADLRIRNSPPQTVDRFTDVVISADGEDPRFCTVRNDVRKIVERYFESVSENESEMSRLANGEYFLTQNPKLEKWINRCLSCNAVGYKPEMPERLRDIETRGWLRRYFRPLPVDKCGLCESCRRQNTTAKR